MHAQRATIVTVNIGVEVVRVARNIGNGMSVEALIGLIQWMRLTKVRPRRLSENEHGRTSL
jgi:hypothetical protein